MNESIQKATFAGGCFWCMEPPYEQLDGVLSVVVGYTGGHKENPSYKEVTAGNTGHAEAIQITYDANKVSYKTLLEIFWQNIDPTVKNRQFCDVGSQYRTAVFYHDDEQKKIAEEMKASFVSTKQLAEVFTEIVPASTFYLAEEYHQNYYKKNPIRYKFYRYSCGRDKRLEQLWGKKKQD